MALDPSVIARLRFVRVSDPTLDVSCLPNFFFAGPQRTGSTWLHSQLANHPQVFLSEPKELYFFNLLGLAWHPMRESDDLVDYMRHFRQSDEYRARREADAKANYGEHYEPIAIGEATASYAAGLDDARMADVVALQPCLRMVIVVRDPVERAWSHAKLTLGKQMGRKMADVPVAEIEKYLRDPYVLGCGLYTRFVAKWGQHMPNERIMLRDFDDIGTGPVRMLCDVMTHLGVRSDAKYVRSLDKGTNRSEATGGVPEPYRSLLASYYKEEIERIRDEWGIGKGWNH